MRAAVVAASLAQSALAVANPLGPGIGNGNDNWGPGGNMSGWGGYGGRFPGGFGGFGFGNGAAKCAVRISPPSCFRLFFNTNSPEL